MNTTKNKARYDYLKPIGTSCGALTWRKIGDEYEMLLIRQGSSFNTWGAPKGHIIDGETKEQCAVREVKEETNVDVRLTSQLMPVFHKSSFESKFVYLWIAEQVCENNPDCSGPESEVAEVRWLNVKHIPALISYQSATIKHAIDKIVGIVDYEFTIEEKISKQIIENMMLVRRYTDTTDFWEFRAEIMKYIHRSYWCLFSKKENKHDPRVANEFETWLAKQWEKVIGNKVILTKESE